MDTQECSIKMESFKHLAHQLTIDWMETPVEVQPSGYNLGSFTYRSYSLHDCSESYILGHFSCREIRFKLRRQIGYYLLQVYSFVEAIVFLCLLAYKRSHVVILLGYP